MQIAVITGGSSGIGQSAAVELAKRGVGVILTYRGNKAGGLATVERIEADGGTAVALPLDTGRSETFGEFREAVERALQERWGRTSFDLLVNNAGHGQMSMFEDTTEELFDDLVRVHLKGPYFLTQTLLPLMEDGGAIVNTTSNSSLPSGMEAGYSVYGSLKGALTVLTRYLALEFSRRGIRVNSVSPGPTRTRLGGDAFAKYPELIPPIAAKTALGRIGEPEDIGRMIAVLLSDDAGWVTAQNVEVSGGYNL